MKTPTPAFKLNSFVVIHDKFPVIGTLTSRDNELSFTIKDHSPRGTAFRVTEKNVNELISHFSAVAEYICNVSYREYTGVYQIGSFVVKIKVKPIVSINVSMDLFKIAYMSMSPSNGDNYYSVVNWVLNRVATFIGFLKFCKSVFKDNGVFTAGELVYDQPQLKESSSVTILTNHNIWASTSISPSINIKNIRLGNHLNYIHFFDNNKEIDKLTEVIDILECSNNPIGVTPIPGDVGFISIACIRSENDNAFYSISFYYNNPAVMNNVCGIQFNGLTRNQLFELLRNLKAALLEIK